MWPWEEEPRSIATGILDDETYDWRAVVDRHAHHRRPAARGDRGAPGPGARPGSPAGHAVDPTGSAGLAGLLDLVADGGVGPDDRVGVLFTGVDR